MSAWMPPSVGRMSLGLGGQDALWAPPSTLAHTLLQALGGGWYWMAPVTLLICAVGIRATWQEGCAGQDVTRGQVWYTRVSCLYAVMPLLYSALTLIIYGIHLTPRQLTTLLPPLLVPVSLFLAAGWKSIESRRPSEAQGTFLRQGLLVALALGLCLSPPVALQGDTQAEEYGRGLLDTLPPHSTLLVSDEELGHVLAYLHALHGVRPDIQLFSLQPSPETEAWCLHDIVHPTELTPVDEYLTRNLGRFSIFLAGPWPVPRGPPLSFVPYGLVRLVTSPYVISSIRPPSLVMEF